MATATLQTDPQEDGLSLTTWLLGRAIDDFLKSSDQIEEDPAPPTSLAHQVIEENGCSCVFACAAEAFLDGEDVPEEVLNACERMERIREIDGYPPRLWLGNRLDGPWSFHWVCSLLGFDPERTRKQLLLLPRGEGLRFQGKRLYQFCRTSYDQQKPPQGQVTSFVSQDQQPRQLRKPRTRRQIIRKMREARRLAGADLPFGGLF